MSISKKKLVNQLEPFENPCFIIVVVVSIFCLLNNKPCWIAIYCFIAKNICSIMVEIYFWLFNGSSWLDFSFYVVFRIPSWLVFNSSIIFCISSWLVSINFCNTNWLASIISKLTSSSLISPMFFDLPSFGIQPSYTTNQITTHWAQH
jgi:hypothetical protein